MSEPIGMGGPQWNLQAPAGSVDYTKQSKAAIEARANELVNKGTVEERKNFTVDLVKAAENLGAKGVRGTDKNSEGQQYRDLLTASVRMMSSLPKDEIQETLFTLLLTKGPGNTFQDFQSCITAELMFNSLKR